MRGGDAGILRAQGERMLIEVCLVDLQCISVSAESLLLAYQSNVVVTGVPTKNYRLPSEWIQPHTTVVNVASFKNVDENELLQIEGVQYIPMVGKVTVAMLERNLMRLFYNFHHPDRAYEDKYKAALEAQRPAPWYGNAVQLYTALAATAILGVMLSRSK